MHHKPEIHKDVMNCFLNKKLKMASALHDVTFKKHTDILKNQSILVGTWEAHRMGGNPER